MGLALRRLTLASLSITMVSGRTPSNFMASAAAADAMASWNAAMLGTSAMRPTLLLFSRSTTNVRARHPEGPQELHPARRAEPVVDIVDVVKNPDRDHRAGPPGAVKGRGAIAHRCTRYRRKSSTNLDVPRIVGNAGCEPAPCSRPRQRPTPAAISATRILTILVTSSAAMRASARKRTVAFPARYGVSSAPSASLTAPLAGKRL
jgi:hypothetical protein